MVEPESEAANRIVIVIVNLCDSATSFGMMTLVMTIIEVPKNHATLHERRNGSPGLSG